MEIREGDSFTSNHTGITYEVEEVYGDSVLVSHDRPIESHIGGMLIEADDDVHISKTEWQVLKSECNR